MSLQTLLVHGFGDLFLSVPDVDVPDHVDDEVHAVLLAVLAHPLHPIMEAGPVPSEAFSAEAYLLSVHHRDIHE